MNRNNINFRFLTDDDDLFVSLILSRHRRIVLPLAGLPRRRDYSQNRLYTAVLPFVAKQTCEILAMKLSLRKYYADATWAWEDLTLKAAEQFPMCIHAGNIVQFANLFIELT